MFQRRLDQFVLDGFGLEDVVLGDELRRRATIT